MVKKAMAKRSQDRFQTAAAFASALEHAVTGHIDGLMNLGRVDEDGEIATLSAKSASAAPALARRHSGTKAILIFAGVALLVIGYILVRLAQAH